MSKKIKNDVSKEDLSWMEALDRDDLPFYEDEEKAFEACFGKTEKRIITTNELLQEIQCYIGQPISATFNWTISYRVFYKCCCASVNGDYLIFYNPESNHDVRNELDLKINLTCIDKIEVSSERYDKSMWFYENGKCIFYISFDNERFC